MKNNKVKALTYLESVEMDAEMKADGWEHIETIGAKLFIEHRLEIDYEVSARITSLADEMEHKLTTVLA